MNILVTGARGFIGSRLVPLLSEAGLSVRVFEGDVCRPEDFGPYEDCQAVIHLAASVRPTGTEARPHQLYTNIAGTANVIEFAASGNRRLVFTSTYLYGSNPPVPVHEDSPLAPLNTYSQTKFINEQCIQLWAEEHGLNAISVRIFNAYGPNQPPGFLIRDIIDNISKDEMRLFDVISKRDFIFVDDLCELLTMAVQHEVKGHVVVNAGSGQSHSVGEVAELAIRLSGKSIPLENLDRPVLVAETVADTSKAKELFGWMPKTDLETGLRQTLRSFEPID